MPRSRKKEAEQALNVVPQADRASGESLLDSAFLGEPPRNSSIPRVDRATDRDATESRIRARAHEIWLSRAGGPGDDVSDWLEAERQIRFDNPS